MIPIKINRIVFRPVSRASPSDHILNNNIIILSLSSHHIAHIFSHLNLINTYEKIFTYFRYGTAILALRYLMEGMNWMSDV